MRVFFGKLFLFILPYLLMGVLSLGPMLMSGEVLPLSLVLRMQKRYGMVLYGPAYTNPNPDYKIKGQALNRAQLLVLGTSRVLQFRDIFCTRDPASMYNAGRGIVRPSGIIPFLEGIGSESHPEVLILGLDQDFFNASWDPSGGMQQAGVNRAGAHRKYRTSLRHLLDGRISLASLCSTKDQIWGKYSALGLRARVKGQGFRPDGSVCEGVLIIDPSLGQDGETFTNTIRRIRQGSDRFQYSTRVNPKAIEEIRQALQYCSRRNIHVIAFLPPFAHRVIEEMERTGGFSYMEDIQPKLKPIFKEFGYGIYDFSDLAELGASDAETIGDDSGFHASEVAYLRIFIRLMQEEPHLRRFADVSELSQMLNSAASPRSLDGY